MEQIKQSFWDYPMKRRTSLYICAILLLVIVALFVAIKIISLKSNIAINNLIKHDAAVRGESIAKTIATFAGDDISAHNYRLLQTRFTTIVRETSLSYIALVRVSDNRAVVHTDPKLTAKKLENKEDQIAASSQSILTTQDIRDRKIMDIALRIQTISEEFVLRVGVPYRTKNADRI